MGLKLNIKNLTVQFSQKGGEDRGFEKCSFSANSNEVVAIIGESGCGKSTLLNCIAGFLIKESTIPNWLSRLLPIKEPTLGKYNGDIELSIENCPVAKNIYNMSYLPQDLGLFEHASIWDNLRIAVSKECGSKSPSDITLEIRARAKELLSTLRVPYALNHLVNKLSCGEKQRIAIVRTFLRKDRRLLILDEPFTGIDYATRRDIERFIGEFVKKTGSICLIVSHDIREIASLANKIVVFNRNDSALYQTQIVEPMNILDINSHNLLRLFHGTNTLNASIKNSANTKLKSVHFAPPAVRVTSLEDKKNNDCLFEFTVKKINQLVPEMQIVFQDEDLLKFISNMFNILRHDISINQNDIWITGFLCYKASVGDKGYAELIGNNGGLYCE